MADRDKIVKELIANFETKYREFKEFNRLWDEGVVEGKHSHGCEDFIGWEALEMEKDEWLRLLKKFKGN